MTSESAAVAELAIAAKAFSAAPDDATRSRIAADFNGKLDALMKSGWMGALSADSELPHEYLSESYLEQRANVISDLHIRLAELASVYRGVPEGSSEDAEAIQEYHRVFDDLFRIIGEPFGLSWDAHLPDNLMPKAFNDFWR